MIGLVYQHYKHDDLLLKCMKDLVENTKECVSEIAVSLYIDGVTDRILVDEALQVLSNSGINFTSVVEGSHIGITHARNEATRKLLTSYPEVTQVLHCTTNSTFLKPLTKERIAAIEKNDGLMIISFSCNNWVFDRNHSLTEIYKEKASFSDFLNNLLKPDYLMVMEKSRIKEALLLPEFIGEEYAPEDPFWYICSKDGVVNISDDPIFYTWFNLDGMTASSFGKMRQVEDRNPMGFYYRAKFFIDLFLDKSILLSIRTLKDFTSTLISNKVHSIPFRKYKGTPIYWLLLERISSWSDFNEENNFKYSHER